jgi:hypothetical protein
MIEKPDALKTLPLKDTQWVWVVIENSKAGERLLGQMDEDNKIAFIPAFLEKEAAQSCFLKMARQKGVKYEIQAIIYEDLVRYARDHDFLIFFLDDAGNLMEKVDPAAATRE